MEQQLNNYIKLKLEDGKTVIYVNGERFLHCKKLVINIPFDVIYEINELSIDTLAEKYDKLKYYYEEGSNKYNITPEEEFHAHCSNLQVWIENNYDTQLLHSNLAFPLLKKLTEQGDEKAQKRFKEEIITRFLSGYEGVINFLIDEGYLRRFTNEEFIVLVTELIAKKGGIYISTRSHISYLKRILHLLDPESDLVKNIRYLTFIGGSTSTANFIDPRTLHIPHSIEKLSFLEKLEIGKIWSQGGRKFWLPEFIGNLHSLQSLEIYKSRFVKVGEKNKVGLPDSIGNLHSLHTLNLYKNFLPTLPNSIGKLRSLHTLNLPHNKLKELPDSIGNLKLLRHLDLSHNDLKELPDSIGNLTSLQTLDLSNNNLVKLPESICNLKNLKVLNMINNNLIIILPKLFFKLKSLQNLFIDNSLISNYLKTLSSVKSQLKNLKINN